MKIREQSVFDYRELRYGLDRAKYLEHIGFQPFEWQRQVCHDPCLRKIINGSRQCGKSTIASGLPCHKAKYRPKSLVIIEAPTEVQAGLNMEKIYDFMAHDRKYPKIERKSDSQILLANGSRIRVVVASDKSSRGYSKPAMIVLDEASRIDDVVYRSGVRPMLTSNPDCELILISTPFGKTGFFFDAWYSRSGFWSKYEVRSPWTVDEDTQRDLLRHEQDDAFKKERKENNIRFFYSPRHEDFQEQQENLEAMGIQQYRQEYCCEFIETESQTFTYDSIDRMFSYPTRERVVQMPVESYANKLVPKAVGGEFF